MSEPIAIKKIVLQLGKKEIELSPDEANKLFNALSEIFGKDKIREYISYPIIQYYPKPYPWAQVWSTCQNTLTYDSQIAAGEGH